MQKDNCVNISLIVATYNRPDSLLNLLESLKLNGILAREDVEVIVIENGSTDKDAYQFCHDYNIVYLCQDIPHLSLAVNLGVKNSKGKYIAFTDDDVIISDSSWLDNLHENFLANPKLGYASGNVLAAHTNSEVPLIWERKGGLSKGTQRRTFTQEYLASFDPDWRISKVAAGANSMIPREILDEIGYFSTFLGRGAPIGHGNSLEIVYRIIRAGYELVYDPSAVVLHYHPETPWKLRKKMYIYGMGDVCYQLYIFFEYKDWRYLYGATIRHFNFILGSILMGLVGKYPMPASYRIFSLFGSLVGFPAFLIKYPLWRTQHE